MKFEAKYAGKWIAAKDDKVIGSAKTLANLRKELGKKENMDQVRFELIPKGYIAG